MADLSFDDLIPAKSAKSGGLSFDDLVPAKGAKKKRTWMDEVIGAGANFNRGLGIGDEMAAGFGVVTGLFDGRHKLTDPVGPAYKMELDAQRGVEDEFAAKRPRTAAVTRGAGNALTMAAPIGPGAQAFATGGKAINALRGATVAGLTGAGYAAVDRGSASERFAAASKASVDPLTLGLGAIGGAIAAPRKPRATEAAPSLDELTGRKNDAYARVRESGETYSGDQFRELTDDMTKTMAAEGFNPGNHPKAAAKLDQISDMAHQAADQPMSVEALDQLRQQIGRDVASANDDGERRMGVIMRQAVDDFIERSGGSPDLLEARDLNTRVSKLRDLDQLDDKAARRASRTGSGGNKENALRQNVDRFIDDTGNLTAAEDVAARKVVDGTGIGNALRQVGKLSPEGNGMGLAVHAVGGVTSHGATLPLAAGGFVAKRVSEALTRRNVDELRALIAQGGEAAQEVSRALADPAYAELRQQLANDLSAQAGVQGASASAAR